MKLYIASSFEQKEEVAKLYKVAQEQGHEITRDWTTHRWLDGEENEEERFKLYEEYARQDVEGVLEADVYILLLGERKSAGAHIELGIAFGAMKRIMIVGEIVDPTLFYWHERVERFPNISTAFDALRLGAENTSGA